MTPEIVELLKLSLSLYFSIAKTNAATEEELDALYQTEKDKYDANNPIYLEDV